VVLRWYEVAQTYNFVGEGWGSYEKVNGPQFTGGSVPRKPVVDACKVLAAVFAIAGVVCFLLAQGHFGADSRGLHSAAAYYDCEVGYPSSAKAWPEEQRQWCCDKWGRACSDQATPTPEYDCEGGAGDQWDAGKLAWCCEHHGRGCPTQTGYCALACSFHGVSAPCGARMRWAAAHRFAGQADACQQSHSVVTQQCPACAACDVASAGCTAFFGESGGASTATV
jgi:hypothetical protein